MQLEPKNHTDVAVKGIPRNIDLAYPPLEQLGMLRSDIEQIQEKFNRFFNNTTEATRASIDRCLDDLVRLNQIGFLALSIVERMDASHSEKEAATEQYHAICAQSKKIEAQYKRINGWAAVFVAG